MASNEDKRSSTTTEQEKTTKTENPFIAFRRFADEKIGSALQSLIGLPSAVTKQLEGALPDIDKIRSENARRRERATSFAKDFSQSPQDLLEELQKEHKKRWERLREAFGQGFSADMVKDDRDWSIARSTGFRDQYNDDAKTPRQTAHNLVDLFFSGSNGSSLLAPLSGIFSGLNVQFSSDGFLPYLMFSPYSPLFLDNDWYSGSDEPDTFPYCDAFEDLLLASQGRDMVPLGFQRRRRQLESQLPGRPSDFVRAVGWLSRLQGSGLLGNTPLIEQSSDEEEDSTELAMYKDFLSGAFPKSPVEVRENHTETVSEQEVVKSRVQEVNDTKHLPNNPILSTLTRTETTRFPDGRVETKLVLIKRFADGAETKTESVHTDHEPSKNEGSDQKEKDEKKGWFWT